MITIKDKQMSFYFYQEFLLTPGKSITIDETNLSVRTLVTLKLNYLENRIQVSQQDYEKIINSIAIKTPGGSTGEGSVLSVNGYTGTVVISKDDLGLNSVVNSEDSIKNVLSATKLTTPRTINGVYFDGTSNVAIPVSSETQVVIDSKVDKVGGKVLSTNDYTTVEKTKLSGIATNANNFSLPVGTTGQVLKHNGTSWAAGTDTVGPTYTNATTTVAGLMSSTDKVKLDGLTNVSIIQLTQAAYDVLPPLEKNKDNVLYIIVG